MHVSEVRAHHLLSFLLSSPLSASTTSTKSQLVLRHEHHAKSAVMEQEIDGEATLFAYAAAAALPHMCSSIRRRGRRMESGRRQIAAVCLYVRLHWTQIRSGCQIRLDCRIRSEDGELGAVCLRRRARMPNTPLTKPMSHVPVLIKPIACLVGAVCARADAHVLTL